MLKSAHPKGNCYEAAYKFVFENDTLDQDPSGGRGLTLIHGKVAELRQDTNINHAWVEEGELVHEVSGGRKLTFQKNHYYKKHSVTNVRRYDLSAAMELAVISGHYGPWD